VAPFPVNFCIYEQKPSNLACKPNFEKKNFGSGLSLPFSPIKMAFWIQPWPPEGQQNPFCSPRLVDFATALLLLQTM